MRKYLPNILASLFGALVAGGIAYSWGMKFLPSFMAIVLSSLLLGLFTLKRKSEQSK